MHNGNKKNTQTALARRLGVTKEHLNSVLRGRIRAGGKLALALARETGEPAELWLAASERREEVRAAWRRYQQEEETT